MLNIQNHLNMLKEMAKKKSEEPIGETTKSATETKHTAHSHYLVKKEVAKLLMAKNGTKFQDAFDSIDDAVIIGNDHKAIFESISKD